jgi:uncharacterized protein (TIGR02270 family)
MSVPIVLAVVSQHAEESSVLRRVRSVLVRAPHVRLPHLARWDERIAAHLDGLAVAGEAGRRLCLAALETPGAGEVFVAAVRAIEERDAAGLEKCFALAQAVPESQVGLISAFGWASAQFLQGTIRGLLESTAAFHRAVGLAACAMHRVDPGPALTAAVSDGEPSLRARALRVAGEAGRRDLLPACVKALSDEDVDCRFWAARSALLLGQRDQSLRVLHGLALAPGPWQERALTQVLRISTPAQAQALLKTLAQEANDMRLAILGAGVSGDVHYIPWLIRQMVDDKLARLAGESFSTITGADLAWLDLERDPPEAVEAGPSDSPAEDNVAMDEDDGLPWPDVARVQAWWEANQTRFQPGLRYFVGEPVGVAHCRKVLLEGYQRQRFAAAEYLCLLHPGTPLFPIAAPAWRQKRWLAQASA